MGRLDTFEVSFGRDVAPAILRAEDDHGTTAKDWTVVNLPAGDDYAGALVVEGPCEGLKCFRWSLRHEPFAAPYSVRKLAS